MNLTITDSIKNEICTKYTDSLFTIKDLVHFGSYDTVKRITIRLEKENFISRIIDGIYKIPKYSKLTNEIVPTSPHELALKIADNFSWKIIPTGNYSLNLLGLSNQVPTTYEYLSSGPYRNYNYGNTIIKFRHTRNAEIELSYEFSLIISAIRTLGQSKINDGIIGKLSGKLTSTMKKRFLIESKKVTSWIYEIVKEICNYDKVS